MAVAWAAGILDQSGSFLISEDRNTKRQRPRIIVKTKAHANADRLREILGGNVRRMVGRSEWSVSGAKACVAVHHLVIPSLHGKVRLAQLHLAYCDLVVAHTHRSRGFDDRGMSEDEKNERERLRWAIIGWRPA